MCEHYCVILQLTGSPGNWVRELFKPWKDVVSLLVCNQKKFHWKRFLDTTSAPF